MRSAKQVPLLFISAIAVALSGCGPCGDVKRIGLVGEPQAQLDHDRAMFVSYWYRYDQAFQIGIDLYEMARHRDVAAILVRLGYLRRDGNAYAFTAKARSEAYIRQRNSYDFALETANHPIAPPFLAAYETVACNETHDFFRTYSFKEYVGPLTPFGKALLANRLLYLGHDDVLSGRDGKPGSWQELWRGRKQSIYHIWFFPPPGYDDPGTVFGELLGWKWDTTPDS